MNLSSWFRNHNISLKHAGVLTIATESYTLNSKPLAVVMAEFGDIHNPKIMYIDGGDPSKGHPYHNISGQQYYRDKIGLPNAMEQLDDWLQKHPVLISYTVNRFTKPFLLKVTPNIQNVAILDVVDLYKSIDTGELPSILNNAETFYDLVSNCVSEVPGKGYTMAELVQRTVLRFDPTARMEGFRRRSLEVMMLLDNVLLNT